jgi:hypothetical protein
MSASTAAPATPVPRYGEAALADIVPSLLSALDVPGFANPLALDPADRVCLLLIDGLGWELLARYPKDAPFLSGLAGAGGRPLTAGFPSTTATSIGSIGTGLTPGEHGLVGYTMAVPGRDRAMNALLWETYGSGPKIDLRDEVPPEQWQPSVTAFERAAADGVTVTLVGPREHAHSGMTRAVLRGGRYHGVVTLGDLAVEAAIAAGSARRSFVYAYEPSLDLVGHVRGPGSPAWRLQLGHVDAVAEALASRLPRGAVLVVTGDHGMVNLAPAERIDVDENPDLLSGVRMLAGEARARHVHTRPGAEADVMANWRAVLGDRMWIVSRHEAVAAGWFGPTVPDWVLPRIGDVVAAAFGAVGIVQRSVDALQARMAGHHGSLTADEQLVPYLEHRS